MPGTKKESKIKFKGRNPLHISKKKEQKFELKQTTDGKLVFYKSIKVVKRIGNSGHVVLPKELIGKEVQIVWEEEK